MRTSSRRRSPRCAAGPAKGASGAGGGKGGDDEPDWQLHGSLIRRFTLVERSGAPGTRARLPLEDRAHAPFVRHAGREHVARLAAYTKDRREPRGVRPDGNDRPEDHDQPLPRPADEAVRGLVREAARLLRYLCGEDESTYTPVSDWVLKWCAYQVQHVGAKMRTAIVMHGPEGSGKNQFWSAMQEIFHPYSAQIGQAELEDKFNGWLSARLFLLANEVVTRSEMSHHVGKLKAYVTEPYLHIRTAYMDARYEANHANIVFLSNEFQPLKISPGDRRYMVIRTPPVMDEVLQGRGGRAEGGRRGRLHALPARARARRLQRAHQAAHHRREARPDRGRHAALAAFWQEIKDGLVQLPYCPALADDVYRAYVLWCTRRGHKMPEAQHRFTPAFMSMNGVRRAEPRVPDPEKMHEIALAETS
jgi:hypothetical protein